MIEKASTLLRVTRAHQLELQLRHCVFKRANIFRFVYTKRNLVFEKSCCRSPSHAFKHVKRLVHPSLPRLKFEVMEIRLAHRSGEGTAPISFMQVNQHPVDHVLGVLIERLGFTGSSSPRLEVRKNCEIPGQVISVSDAPAGIDPDGGTVFGGLNVPGIAIEPCKIDHCLTFSAIEIIFLRNVARLFQIGLRRLAISFLKRKLSEA